MKASGENRSRGEGAMLCEAGNARLLAHLPFHTCYVEVFFAGLWRIFAKRSSCVEVVNDHDRPGIVNLVRQLKGGKPEDEVRLYHEILQSWYARFPSAEERPDLPLSGEELRSALYAPYRRMRTVIWEDLPWLACMQRYDDPRTVQIIEPSWPDDDRDRFAALALRLSNARCHWAVSIPDTQPIRALFWPLARPTSIVERWGSARVLLTNFVLGQTDGNPSEQKEEV